MRIENLLPGDILVCMGAKLVYARLVRVNRKTVTVQDERGDLHRVCPAGFHRKLLANEWRPESVGGPKACPFDGGEGEWRDCGGRVRWRVVCTGCGAGTMEFATTGLALAAWNRRKEA